MTVKQGNNCLLFDIGIGCCEVPDIKEELTLCLTKNNCNNIPPINAKVDKSCGTKILICLEVKTLDKGWYMYELKSGEFTISNGHIYAL